MEKYSIELTRDELVRVIEGLGLLMDEAQEEQDKVQSLSKFSDPDKRCILSERTIEKLDKHILFIKSEISKIDNLISKLMEVQA